MPYQDTFLHRTSATSEAGAVTALAEERKIAKYADLSQMHHFAPVAVETTGVFGPQTKTLIKDLGRRIMQATGEEAATTYLIRRLSVAAQRSNSASVMGTTGQHDFGLFD